MRAGVPKSYCALAVESANVLRAKSVRCPRRAPAAGEARSDERRASCFGSSRSSLASRRATRDRFGICEVRLPEFRRQLATLQSAITKETTMAQTASASTVHDVVVVGSGAGGGTVTKVLADPRRFRAAPRSRADAELAGPQRAHVAVQGAASRRGRPRARPTSEPADRLHLQRHVRRRAARGRAVHGGARQRLLRGSDRGSSAAAPTTTAASRCASPTTTSSRARATAWASTGRSATRDLAPYYDKAEALHRRHRQRREASAARPTASSIRRCRCGCTTRSCSAVRDAEHPRRRGAQAVTTVPRTAGRGCHYCGQCGRGCLTASNYASSYVQIFPAMKTGRVQVLANAMARELITDATGKVTAVSYIDKTTGPRSRCGAGTVVLAASACESARLLLNSKSSRIRKGSPTRRGRSASTSRTPSARACRRSVPALSGMPRYNSRRLRLAPLRARGGDGTSSRSSASRAGITSKSAAATACPASARSRDSRAPPRATAKKLKDKRSARVRSRS